MWLRVRLCVYSMHCIGLKLENGAKCHIEYGNFQAHVYIHYTTKKTLTLETLRANVIQLTASMRTIFLCLFYTVSTREVTHSIKLSD